MAVSLRAAKAKAPADHSALKAEFVAWLWERPQARVPQTQAEWAEGHGLHPVTVTNWKHDPMVLDLLEKWQGPFRKRFGEVVSTMFHRATTDDDPSGVAAARSLAEWLDLVPTRKSQVDLNVTLSSMMQQLGDGSD